VEIKPSTRRRIDPRGVYTRTELIKLLDVDKSTIARAYREEGLKHARVGAGYVFLGQWILEWLESIAKQHLVAPERNGAEEPWRR